MSRAVCGICMCTYGDAEECACPKGYPMTTQHTEQSERAELIERMNTSADWQLDGVAPGGKPLVSGSDLRKAAALLAADKPAESGGEVDVSYERDVQHWITKHGFTREQAETEVRYRRSRRLVKSVLVHTPKPQADKVGGEAVACQTPETCFYAGCHGACTQPQPSALPDDVVKDAERLNNIEKTGLSIHCSWKNTGWCGGARWSVGIYGGDFTYGETLRETIDAAMLKEGK